MTDWSELAFMDATAQAELVRQRKIKPLELVDAAIDRVERLNPTLNAVVTPMYEEARVIAKGKLPDGPFTGVPFLLKGVRYYSGGAQTQSLAMRCRSGTVRWIDAWHNFARLDKLSYFKVH